MIIIIIIIITIIISSSSSSNIRNYLNHHYCHNHFRHHQVRSAWLSGNTPLNTLCTISNTNICPLPKIKQICSTTSQINQLKQEKAEYNIIIILHVIKLVRKQNAQLSHQKCALLHIIPITRHQNLTNCSTRNVYIYFTSFYVARSPCFTH